MSFPMTGYWRVRVVRGHEFSIHGDRYWELYVERSEDEASDKVHVLRVPSHILSTLPPPGQMMRVEFLVGQVTAIHPDLS
ncbi:MAG: hypothetical protein KatS3mg104_2140 [Phycisphaerae bacterium]|nr:MAG: hypothetical protein KatS3mg104_2140 [Phycisphaerae bacterium]